MRNKILAVVSIVKVAQDHVAEMKAHPSNDETSMCLIEDVELGLGWLLKKLEKLNAKAVADLGARESRTK